jgi:rhodanese-related sulfurtransferase
VALTLRQQGFDAHALEGGYDAWLREGMPTEPLQREHAGAPGP